MGTKELIKEIEKLPLSQRKIVIEQVMKSIRENDRNNTLSNAVAELESEYRTNSELTVFTDIDLDNFYEAK